MLRKFQFKYWLSLTLLFFQLQNCTLSPGSDSGKSFQGLLGYFLSVNSSLSSASLSVSGSLKDSSGAPISGAKLSVNFSLFGNYTRDPVDSSSTTGTNGEFTLKLNPGVFTINIFSLDGRQIGFFTLELQGVNSVTVRETSGNIQVVDLKAEKFIPNNPGGCSNCGDVTAISSSGNRILIAANQENTYIYESIDAFNFSKNPVQFENCVNSYPSNICRLIGVSYDSILGTYAALGIKEDCSQVSTAISCQQVGQFIGISSTLSGLVLKSTSIPNFAGYYSGDIRTRFINSNGIIFLLTTTNSILMFSNNTWTTQSFSAASPTTPISTCNHLYIANDGILACGLKSYYLNGWQQNISTSTNYIFISYGFGRFFSGPISTSTSPSNPIQTTINYSNSGEKIETIPTGLTNIVNLSSASTSQFYSPFFFTQSSMVSIKFITEQTSTGMRPSISGVVQSSDGTNFSELPFNAAIPSGTTVESPIGIGSTSGNFIFGIRVRDSRGFVFPAIFRSTNGANWELIQPLN